jgi:drug/metabolite transporter (DMT)-like permease
VTAIFFGLATALSWGVTSLCSARASRITGAVPTLAFVSLFGLIVSIPLAVADSRSGVATADILWAGLAGLGNVAGLLLLYIAVRRGKVGLAAPIVATEGAIVAVIALLTGETVDALVIGLLALVVVGVVMATLDLRPTADQYPVTARFLALVILGSIAFGIGLYSGGRVAGIVPGGWIVASARIIGVTIVTIPLFASGGLTLSRAALPWILITAVAEVIGYWMYVLGSRADLAVTAILASQFGAVTAVGAFLFLGERLSRLQRLGVAILCVGVGLLAWVRA